MEHLEHLLQTRIFLLSSALIAFFNKHLHHAIITSCHEDHCEVFDQFSLCAVGINAWPHSDSVFFVSTKGLGSCLKTVRKRGGI